MIFKPEHARAILAGRKTQHRLPIVAPELAQRRTRNGNAYNSWTQPFEPRPGERVSVRPDDLAKGEEETCGIIITNAEQARLGSIHADQARAEGCATVTMFMDYWVRWHDRAWLKRRAENPPDLEDIVHRFQQRHADRDVWVMTFVLDKSPLVKLLTPAARPAGSELGFIPMAHDATSTPPGAMGNDSERIDPDDLAYDWSQGAALQVARAKTDRLDEQLADLSPEARMRELREMAHARGLRVRDDFRAIDRILDRVEQKIRRAA